MLTDDDMPTGCRKRRAADDVVEDGDEVDFDELDSSFSSGQGRTKSGRKVRKNNSLNIMFNSRYRHPDNQEKFMGELMQLGKVYAIIAVMTHGPDLPTEISQHNQRHRIFVAAAKYALSQEDLDIVLAHKDADEKRIYYHNLLTTSTRPLTTLLFNDARDWFQTKVFNNPCRPKEYWEHLGLDQGQSVYDQ